MGRIYNRNRLGEFASKGGSGKIVRRSARPSGRTIQGSRSPLDVILRRKAPRIPVSRATAAEIDRVNKRLSGNTRPPTSRKYPRSK